MCSFNMGIHSDNVFKSTTKLFSASGMVASNLKKKGKREDGNKNQTIILKILQQERTATGILQRKIRAF